MNDMNEYTKPRADLKDAIMNGILTNEQQRKSGKRKEKTILFIYVGAIFFALLVLFFLEGLQVLSPKVRLSSVTEFASGRQDFLVYYKMFIVSLVFSLIAFGIYFVKSRRSHTSSITHFAGIS